MKRIIINISICLLLFYGCKNQRMIDESYQPNLDNPLYEFGKGSLILIDEAHNNFHTKDGLYNPLAKLLAADGYLVESIENFSNERLSESKILIISNAMPKNHKENTSAFTDNDVKTIENWVRNGGSLFLIADHMPCPEAATKLAKSFGIEFINCYALDTTKNDFDYFSKKDSTLVECVVTKGRGGSEIIDSVVSFTGQAFVMPEGAIPVLKFRLGYVMAFPNRPWKFDKTTKYVPIDNQVQGAIFEYHEGRIAVFGEASMFTAQISEINTKLGFGYSGAKQNEQFTLNIIHWLDGEIE